MTYITGMDKYIKARSKAVILRSKIPILNRHQVGLVWSIQKRCQPQKHFQKKSSCFRDPKVFSHWVPELNFVNSQLFHYGMSGLFLLIR